MFVKYLVVMFGPSFCVLVSTVLPNIFRFPTPPKKKKVVSVAFGCIFAIIVGGNWLLAVV